MKQIFLLVIILVFSCTRKNDSSKNHISYAHPLTTENKTTKDTIYLDKVNEELSGVYYSEYIRPEKGFYLKRERPNNDFFLYELEFKNGNITFKDLTEFYDCGNGIFSLKKASYEKNEKGNYNCIFKGEYALEQTFEVEGEYVLTENKKGEKYLAVINISKNNRKEIYLE